MPLYDKYDKYILRYENHNDIMHLEYQKSVNTFDLNMIQITFKNSGEGGTAAVYHLQGDSRGGHSHLLSRLKKGNKKADLIKSGRLKFVTS